MLRFLSVPGSFPPSRRRCGWGCQTPRSESSPARRVCLRSGGWVWLDWTRPVWPGRFVFADATGETSLLLKRGSTSDAVGHAGPAAAGRVPLTSGRVGGGICAVAGRSPTFQDHCGRKIGVSPPFPPTVIITAPAGKGRLSGGRRGNATSRTTSAQISLFEVRVPRRVGENRHGRATRSVSSPAGQTPLRMLTRRAGLYSDRGVWHHQPQRRRGGGPEPGTLRNRNLHA